MTNVKSQQCDVTLQHGEVLIRPYFLFKNGLSKDVLDILGVSKIIEGTDSTFFNEGCASDTMVNEFLTDFVKKVLHSVLPTGNITDDYFNVEIPVGSTISSFVEDMRVGAFSDVITTDQFRFSLLSYTETGINFLDNVELKSDVFTCLINRVGQWRNTFRKVIFVVEIGQPLSVERAFKVVQDVLEKEMDKYNVTHHIF